MQGIRHQTVKARKTCRQLKVIVLDSAVKKRQRHLMFAQVSLQGFSYISYASLVGFSYFTHASLVVVVIVTYFYWDHSRRSHLKPTFGETELSGKRRGSQLVNLAASGDEASCKDERDSSRDERNSWKNEQDSSMDERDSSKDERDSSEEETDYFKE